MLVHQQDQAYSPTTQILRGFSPWQACSSKRMRHIADRTLHVAVRELMTKHQKDIKEALLAQIAHSIAKRPLVPSGISQRRHENDSSDATINSPYHLAVTSLIWSFHGCSLSVRKDCIACQRNLFLRLNVPNVEHTLKSVLAYQR